VVYYNEVVKNDTGYTLDPPKTETRMLTDMSEAEVLAVVRVSAIRDRGSRVIWWIKASTMFVG